MARHAVVDLAQVFRPAPRAPAADRLPAPMLAQLRAELAAAGFHLAEGAAVDAGLVKLREMYEPYVEALSRYLLQPLPAWHLDTPRRDNWQTSAWDRRRAPGRPSGRARGPRPLSSRRLSSRPLFACAA